MPFWRLEISLSICLFQILNLFTFMICIRISEWVRMLCPNVLPGLRVAVFRRVRKIANAIISFIMSVHLSIWKKIGFHWKDFYDNRYYEYFFENLSRNFNFH
jgi:predicted signal transduction protein with EAL and GGDEF domain